MIRNYIHFEKIHIANSGGFALWKGNNPSLKIEGFGHADYPQNLSAAAFENIEEFENIKFKLENIPLDNF